MTQKFNIIFFSEVNSKFGMPIFKMLYHDDRFNIKAFVTTPEGKLCSYYINEDDPVDLEKYAESKDIPVFRPNNDTVSSALAKLKACAPGNAYVQINDNVFKVNSVSWSQTSKAKLKLKDGRLSFFLENAL